MRRTVVTLCLFLLSFSLFSQTVESARMRMNNGQYNIAKAYWKALNDNYNKYSSEIAICESCEQLQKEALYLMSKKRYTKAIEKYQSILDKNPSDNIAPSQIQKCKTLREAYLAANDLQTYTNNNYGYSLKLPSFMTKDTKSNNENVVFWSPDSKICIKLITSIEFGELTDSKILDKVTKQYNGTKVVYRKADNNWIVTSGYQANGAAYYEKSILVNRRSQLGEPVKVVITAVVISPKDDIRVRKIPENIHKTLNVTATGPSLYISETDEDRFQRALRINTIKGYNNYIIYAPVYSKHKEEAKARRSVLEARESYKRGLYSSAKNYFELGIKYLSTSDQEMYANSYYMVCRDNICSIDVLNDFVNKFPNYAQMKVIKGRFVKTYCYNGLFATAKRYVRNNYGIWYDENTPYSRRQWMKFIRDCKRARRARSSASNQSLLTNISSASTNVSFINDTKMTLSSESISLNVGVTTYISAYNYGTFLFWESDNPRVATISSSGIIKGISEGRTTIWAKGKEYRMCTVTVVSQTKPSQARTVYTKNIYMRVGETIKAYIDNGYVSRWEITKNKSAYVRAYNDELKALKAGNITVWGYVDNSPKLFIITVK